MTIYNKMNAFHEIFGESSKKVQRPISLISKDWTIENLSRLLLFLLSDKGHCAHFRSSLEKYILENISFWRKDCALILVLNNQNFKTNVVVEIPYLSKWWQHSYVVHSNTTTKSILNYRFCSPSTHSMVLVVELL